MFGRMTTVMAAMFDDVIEPVLPGNGFSNIHNSFHVVCLRTLRANEKLGYRKAKVTTLIRLSLNVVRLPLDCNSTALQAFDDLRYDRRPPCCGLLHYGLNK